MSAAPGKSVRNSTTAAILCAVVIAVPLAIIGIHFATRFDFLPYWISAHLLAAGHDPYDRGVIFAIERGVGNREAAPFIMRNPPWALPVVAPLGYLGIHWGAFVWLLSMLLFAGLSVGLLTRDCPWVRLRAAFFAPLFIALMVGQLTTLVLFAAACFLTCRHKRPFVSGVVLSLAALKAHLLVLFWPILLIDCYRRRNWRIPAGLLFGVAMLTGLAFLWDPHAWAQYRRAMLHDSLTLQYLPDVSADIRFLFARRHPWVQLVPSLVGVAWAIRYYVRTSWDWMEQGAVLLAVSAVLSPYSWSCDMALMLPLVLRVPANRRVEDLYLLCCIVSFVLSLWVNSWASPWLSLIGPLWLGWYAVARRLSPVDVSPVPLEPSPSH